MRAAVSLAVPAGLLSSGISPLSAFGIVWMSTGARHGQSYSTFAANGQRGSRLGAGARIGLVTGFWQHGLLLAVSGVWLFVQRIILHQPNQIDLVYTAFLEAFQEKANESMAGMAPPTRRRCSLRLSTCKLLFCLPKGMPVYGHFQSQETVCSWSCLPWAVAHWARVFKPGAGDQRFKILTCGTTVYSRLAKDARSTWNLIPLLHNLLRCHQASYHPPR